ncbi:MAG: YitT family protein [Bacteroidales bacterium]|nr:YitT family protein [Bacteroidales bacterium]MBQ2491807.1 YitT family protein [Bacteroidales bacterium]
MAQIIFTKQNILEYSLLAGGCFIFSLGAVLLIEPYGFAPGGTYGLSMVFHHLWGWRTEVSALCMDIPLLVIGTIVLGSRFGIKTLLCTLLIPAFMWLIHQTYGFDSLIEPEVSQSISAAGLSGVEAIQKFDHQLLAAIFGGILYGIGLGMIFRSRATSGGSDIISMIINKYLHISMGTAVTIVDGLITLSTVIAFGDWKLPMYSWIIIILESVIIDKVIEGQSAKTMMIISTKPDEIRKVIIEDMHRGATLIHATGMYRGEEKNIIYVTLTRREVVNLRFRIAAIDPEAFINILNSSETIGRGFKSIKE